jgi:hypothetical protein
MPVGPAFKNKPAGGATSPSFVDDPSDAVFARIATILRASTELHSCTIRAWDDASVDQSPPGADGPPWMRLTPIPGPSEPFAVDAGGLVHEMPLEVRIETSVPGTEVVQSMRFWGAIRRALFPGRFLDEQLQMAGVSWIAVKQPAWGAPDPAAKDAGPASRCEGVGRIELVMYFYTPE